MLQNYTIQFETEVSARACIGERYVTLAYQKFIDIFSRIKRKLSMPRPTQKIEDGDGSERVLGARLISPDSAIFVRPDSLRRLSSSKNSPFNVLNTHSKILETCGLKLGDSFRYQATPCMELPDERRAMEFVSSVWEDKKPNINAFDSAYRQNRMACASAARHLHSFNVHVPVFGLLWADGKVRAHVDWCAEEGERLVSVQKHRSINLSPTLSPLP